jgi:hypothetical protein
MDKIMPAVIEIADKAFERYQTEVRDFVMAGQKCAWK